MEQIVPEPEPKTSKCWRRSRFQKHWMPRAGAGAWNLGSGSRALLSNASLQPHATQRTRTDDEQLSWIQLEFTRDVGTNTVPFTFLQSFCANNW